MQAIETRLKELREENTLALSVGAHQVGRLPQAPGPDIDRARRLRGAGQAAGRSGQHAGRLDRLDGDGGMREALLVGDGRFNGITGQVASLIANARFPPDKNLPAASIPYVRHFAFDLAGRR
ncbi:hypothetical protein [Massilia sp. TWR1-2-2]|uniref:hypothetical protein n=1 Tax=Massilia sp. TWR1-2-2 TaxID=2804584 RepID=UPI003CE6D033